MYWKVEPTNFELCCFVIIILALVWESNKHLLHYKQLCDGHSPHSWKC